MPDVRKLSDHVSAAPQLAPSDIAALAATGVAVIVNNRPDGESIDQPPGSEIEAAAVAAGVSYHHIPVAGGAIDPASVQAFADALEQANGKVVAFCRSGTRSTMLWALSRAGKDPAEQIINAAATAGYDVSSLRPYLET